MIRRPRRLRQRLHLAEYPAVVRADERSFLDLSALDSSPSTENVVAG